MAPSPSKLSLGGLVCCCTLNAGGALKKCPGKGVRFNIPRGELPAGWTVHYDEPYSHATTLANIRPGNGACILWGAQKVGQPNFDIVATADRVEVETKTNVWINDAFWYTADGLSAGFASVANIDIQEDSPGDTGQYSEFSRVSWLLGRGEGGFRAGTDTTAVRTLAEWRKVVMYGPEIRTCQATICGDGIILKSTLPDYCSGVDCTENECCENAGKCKKTDCNGRYVLKKEEDVPSFCSGAICAQHECCTTAPKCNSAVCGPLYHLKTLMTGLPGQCSSAICSRDECCKINPACASSDCDVGFVLKPTGQPSACATPDCTSAECCTNAGTCSESVCLGEYKYKSAAQRPSFCNGVVCTRDECCGGYLPPTASVLNPQLLDLDLDEMELGGNVTWSPPSSQNHRVTNYQVYLSNSRSVWRSGIKVGEAAFGTNWLSIPADSQIRLYLAVYTANEGGLQMDPPRVTINDTRVMPSQFSFTDLDLDENEIGGFFSWYHGDGTLGVVQGYNVYSSASSSGMNKILLGKVPINASMFDPAERISFSVGPDLPFLRNFLLYPYSAIAEKSTGGALAIDDKQAYVYNLDFMADATSLSGAEIKGTIKWKAPTLNRNLVTGYRVYFTDGDPGVYRQQVGGDVDVGTTEVDVPDGFEKENFTHIQVVTLSEFAEQTQGTSFKFSTGSAAAAIAAGTLGLGAAGRMASAAQGANSAKSAGEGMRMDKMERCAAKTSNLTAKSVTAIGDYINKDREEFQIKGCGGQYIRSILNSMMPCAVHHHHERIVLKGPDCNRALYRLHPWNNTWDDHEVILKKISNSYFSVVGLSPEPFLLKRKAPTSRIFSPLGVSGVMAKGLAPILALIVIAIVTCGLQDWLTGAILAVAGVCAIFFVLFAKPGGLLTQCVNGIKNSPPAKIRDSFWSFVGLLVGILPATPAFMAGTLIGYMTGILAVFCALMSFLGRDVFSMFMQFAGGGVLTIFCIIKAATSKDDESKVDIVLFVSAALVIVSGIDNYVKNTAAKFQDIDLPEDEIVKNAEQSSKDIGVSICNAIALEAFISGHMEARLQSRLLDALEGLAQEAVSLSRAVLNYLVEKIQEEGLKKTHQSFNKRVPQLVKAYAPLSARDARIIEGASEEDSHWANFESAFRSLIMETYTERSIKDIQRGLFKVRQSVTYLRSRVESTKRLAGADARAAHRISQVVVGHRADIVKQLAEDLQRRVPVDGDLVEMVKYQEKVDLIREDIQRLTDIIDGIVKAAGADEIYENQIDFEKMQQAQTSAKRAANNLQTVGRLVQPGTLLHTENVRIVARCLGTVADAAASIGTVKPRLRRAATVRFDEAVLEEARQELPQLAQVKSEDDRADIVSAYCTARSTAAIVSLVVSEVTSILSRCDTVVEQLTEARASGLLLLNAIRDARQAETLHLLSVRDEVVCWMARYPMKTWTRLKVLHYTADTHYSNLLEAEVERIISRDQRQSIARQFSVLDADTADKGAGQSKWAAKIFGGRSTRRVHPSMAIGSQYRPSDLTMPGRMTSHAGGFRATSAARQSKPS